MSNTETKGYKMTTTTFQTGSEFRVTWETYRPNPAYTPWNRKHSDILTRHKSDVFNTYEEAEAFIKASGDKGRMYIQVRRPGYKNFIAVSDVKKA
jgi:hypothetical protein